MLLHNIEAAIEHNRAILSYRRDFYENIFRRYGESMDIGDEAGILTVLYQGGMEDNQARIDLLTERASDGDPTDNEPQFPEPEDEAMGVWVSQYRWYIAQELERSGCIQDENYRDFEDIINEGNA